MLKIAFGVCVLLFSFIQVIHAETYIREYTYEASEADSKLSSRTIALDQVKLLLLQEIGTHISQSIKITKDGSGNSYASEDVEAVTAGLTKVDILEEQWNGVTYYLKARIIADTKRVLDALEEYKNTNSELSRQQLESLKANERVLKESREEIVRLRNELVIANNKNSNMQLVEEYKAELGKLSTTEMFNKGYELSQKGQDEDALYWYTKVANKGGAGAQFNVGLTYDYGRGVKQDYEKAFYWYEKSAQQGQIDAQNNLAYMYAKGLWVDKDYFKALYWVRKAADKGDAVAQGNLGLMYVNGQAVDQSYSDALYWFQKGADQGGASAQTSLGWMYLKGYAVEQSITDAFYWYKKAANSGYMRAQNNVGHMYFDGDGVSQSYAEAYYWYKKSAEQGYADAQYNLGLMYSKGQWIDKDYTKALYWFRKAAVQGHEVAEKMVKTLTKYGYN